MVTYCLGCDVFFTVAEKNLMLCGNCIHRLPAFPGNACVFSGGDRHAGYIERTMGFDDMHALYFYEGAIRTLILKYKYGRSFHALRTLRALLLHNRYDFTHITHEYDMLVSVPSHFFSLIKRGYNPASRLCHNAILMHQRHRYIIKKKYLPPMALLRGVDRKNALKKQTYRIHPKFKSCFDGKAILIFDDVMTTGTTIRSLARVLRENGASKIGGVIFARNMNRGV